MEVNDTYVEFKTVNEIQEFVAALKDFPGDVDLNQGRMIVDAKSILGICSLNMQDKMKLQVHSGSFEELKEKIGKFFK